MNGPKTVFFLLAMANIAVVAWEYRQGRLPLAGTPVIDRRNSGVFDESVLLLSEAASELSAASLAQPVKPEPEAAPAVCLEAGPFLNVHDFKNWQNRLNGFMQPLIKNAPIPAAYQVYATVPRNTAEAALQALKAEGYRDAWIMPELWGPGRISLGIFARREQADVLRQALALKNIRAELQIRYKNTRSRFGLIRVAPEIGARVETLMREFPDIPVRPAENKEGKACLR